ncbi:MAG: DUF2264 domain-containing protein [Flavobacteriaceae bacterium]
MVFQHKNGRSWACIVILVTSIAQITFAQTDRELWVNELVRMADPVLTHLSEGTLRSKMPAEQSDFEYGDRSNYACLEAFGRLMAGMAPWLELGPGDDREGRLREKYIALSHQAIKNAVDPNSPDYMNFSDGSQPLVDAAFLAQAFLRAPKQLWEPLPDTVKNQVIDAFKLSRNISPFYNNWLLFSATVEAFLAKFADGADYMRIDYALKKHLEWYVGDGTYSDGDTFHWDYYNSFVIQPMLLDIVQVLREGDPSKDKLYKTLLGRSQRYAVILERIISPEGTYPVIGRSSVYRFGSFQVLSQMCLMDQLPKEISKGQARAALTSVLKRLSSAPGLYDDKGWLQLGVVGYQPKMAEPYINTGSLYLTSVGFLPLGLHASHEFWTHKAEDWSMVKVWKGDTSVGRDRYKN